MARPKMHASVNVDAAHSTLTVVVEHAADQSFSRAVWPKARRVSGPVLAALGARGGYVTDSDLGGTYTRDGRVLSTFVINW